MIQLPTTCFAEDEGSLTNSGRWLQWHWAGGTPPGEAKHDTWIMAQIYLRLKALYEKEGGAVPRADPQPALALQGSRASPTPEELAKEINGYALEDVTDPNDPTKVVLQKGKQLAELRRAARRRHDRLRLLDLFRLLHRGGQQDGPARQHRSRRHRRSIPTGRSSWPANRRILYNRASADIDGKPWDPSRKLIEWDGDEMDGLRRAGHRADRQAATWSARSS